MSQNPPCADDNGKVSFHDHHDMLMDAPIGIYISTPEGRFLAANPAMALLAGYETPEELVESITDIAKQIYAHPAEREAFMRLVEDAGEVGSGEFQMLRRDGSVIWVSRSGRGVRDQNGKIIQYQGFIIDITERKLAEKALKESEARLRGITDSTLDAIVMIDHQGVISFWNPAAETIFGYRSDEAIGRNLHYLLAPQKYHEAYQKAFPEFQRTGKGQAIGGTLELVARRKDGQERDVSLSLSALLLNGKWHAVGVVRDITERKRMEQERENLQASLLQAQKMESLGILAGGVAHDFNNLLQTMGGNIQFLLMNKHDVHPDADRLKAVARSIDRAGQLVRQLLLFSRKAEGQRQRVDLNQGVGVAAMILERTIPKMVDIQLHLGDQLRPINADPVQIEQVLLNLGGNAAKVMPKGGTLVIETRNIVLDKDFVRANVGAKPGDHVLLTVSDTSSGMDKEALAHIFDPFFTTKEMGKDNGLGLASVYGIVKGHGGHIRCTSVPGQGTTFKIYLPAMEDESAVKAEGPSARIVSLYGTETILIVDDETDIRELTEEALQACGYKVLAAANGEEALAMYAEKGPSIDMIILDLNMPGMGGHQCLQKLLRLDSGVQVLIASGYSAAGQARVTLQAGAVGFIGKPYQFTELLTKVREVLDHAGPSGSDGPAVAASRRQS